VIWEYRKIVLNEHHRKSDDIDLLCELGADRWELVTITPNNIAYLKRELEEPRSAQSETAEAEETVSRVEPKYREPCDRRDMVWSRPNGNLAQAQAGCRRGHRRLSRLISHSRAKMAFGALPGAHFRWDV
jgi:hypothetical protein